MRMEKIWDHLKLDLMKDLRSEQSYMYKYLIGQTGEVGWGTSESYIEKRKKILVEAYN